VVLPSLSMYLYTEKEKDTCILSIYLLDDFVFQNSYENYYNTVLTSQSINWHKAIILLSRNCMKKRQSNSLLLFASVKLRRCSHCSQCHGLCCWSKLHVNQRTICTQTKHTRDMVRYSTHHTHTHTRLMALFQDYLGKPVPES